jgi:HD-GYP domain-containing protein (c-di-GMP phosphodiesterase class II)
MPEVGRQHCEMAVLLAGRMGFAPDFQAAIHQGFERWDGSGQPTRAKGEAIALPMRIAAVALDADRGHLLGGAEGALAFVAKHSGRELEPRLAQLFIDHFADFRPLFAISSGWQAALEHEPGPAKMLDDEGIDQALLAMADFGDLKSRYTRGHSRAVAELGALAAKQLGLGAEQERTIRRAGLVHDIGRVAVSALIWDKPGTLSDADWERVRLHSYVGERILTRAPGLRDVAELAGSTHERLDGHGYHRRLSQGTSLGARLLAAADMYQALVSERPHRPALGRDEAAKTLREAAGSGALASDAVEAVLGAAGHRAAPSEAANLTARELEVLALVARGLTNKEIGSALDISAKTAGRHLEHIFEKLEVTTRAGATLVALQRGLIKP